MNKSYHIKLITFVDFIDLSYEFHNKFYLTLDVYLINYSANILLKQTQCKLPSRH